MPRKIYYSEGRRIKGGGVEEREKRVDIVGVEQAVLQQKKERGREGERDNVRALSRKAFLTSVDCLL
jgi:hypothetical protein